MTRWKRNRFFIPDKGAEDMEKALHARADHDIVGEQVIFLP